MTGENTSGRPLLLLDVDGVLSPTGVALPPGFERIATKEYSVVIRRGVDERPLAWLDDELYEDAVEWARVRPAPTLLVRTRASIGLTRDDVERLFAFAQQVRDP